MPTAKVEITISIEYARSLSGIAVGDVGPHFMYYVYIIKSIAYPDQLYVGCTQDLKKRLSNHNYGTTEHTQKYRPWNLEMYLAFSDKQKAIDFESYLKSHSGRAFRNKRLL